MSIAFDSRTSLRNLLNFGKRLPVILQSESTECGLAGLAMISTYHGYRVDLTTLRSRFSISLKGATLADLMAFSSQIGLATRAVKLELDELGSLRTPCILHWDLDHFVVLRRVGKSKIVVHDPARGECTLPLREVSTHFTGIALELWPDSGFKPASHIQSVNLRDLVGQTSGMWAAFGQILFLALSLEVFAIASPLFIQWVIDNVVVSADVNLLNTLVIGFILLLLSQVAVSVTRSWAVMHLSNTVNVQWKSNVFSHLLRLPVSYFEKRHLGDVVSRFGSVDQIQSTITTSFIEAILDGLMIVVTLIVMFAYSPKLTALVIAAVLAYGLIRWIWYSALMNATSSQIVLAAKQQTHFLESVRGIRTLKLFQRESERQSTWISVLVDQINAGIRTQRLQIVYEGARMLLTGLENILVIWLGAKMVLDGKFTIGALMAYNAYRLRFDSRATSLIDRVFQFRLLRLHGDRLADIVFQKAEVTNGNADTSEATDLEPSLRIVNVRYRYADHEPFVLDGINLRIKAGQCVSITGPSGGGKSTLLGVLLGIRTPSSGEVYLGDKNLKQIGIQRFRSLVATVMQDDTLFSGSIAENISCFDPGADRERIQECARLACIHEDVTAMPMGYNSIVGDMGAALSGGQKQRILIARALYKKPKILVLDEATSHLDVEREKRINAAIKELEITRIIVAHRIETIRSTERCITIANGRVIADEFISPPNHRAPAEARFDELSSSSP